MGNSPPQRQGPQPHGHQEIHNQETYVRIANLTNEVDNLQRRNRGLKVFFNGLICKMLLFIESLQQK